MIDDIVPRHKSIVGIALRGSSRTGRPQVRALVMWLELSKLRP